MRPYLLTAFVLAPLATFLAGIEAWAPLISGRSTDPGYAVIVVLLLYPVGALLPTWFCALTRPPGSGH